MAKLIDETLVDHAFRSQIYLERLKNGLVTRRELMLQQVDRLIRSQLSAGIQDRNVLVRILGDTDTALETIYSEYRSDIYKDMADIAQVTASYETAFLNGLVPAQTAAAVASFTTPSLNQLIAAYKSEPLMAKGVGAQGGTLLDSALTGMTDYQRNTLTGIIRQGYSQGLGMDEIIRQVRGTQANKYKDGALSLLGRNADAVVRTAVQHVAETVKQEIYAENDDLVEGYKWVSTLDNRTSTICRSLDGKEFRGVKSPKPPAHINCRSSTIPLLSKEFDWLDEGATRAARSAETGKTVSVEADITYYDWLKRQPAGYQREVLGDTKYKLFTKGGMTAKEFGRMNLNRAFQPLTIWGKFDESGALIEEGMVHKSPMAFRKAGLL